MIDYLKSPPTIPQLKAIVKKLGISPKELVRKNEPLFSELRLAKATDTELIQAMTKHPILIERPLIISQQKAIIGRPPTHVFQIIGE